MSIENIDYKTRLQRSRMFLKLLRTGDRLHSTSLRSWRVQAFLYRHAMPLASAINLHLNTLAFNIFHNGIKTEKPPFGGIFRVIYWVVLFHNC